jgi:hypothetical protein
MKKKLLSVALLSALAAPAFATDDSGVYLVGLAGNTTNITNVETSPSLTGLIGYQFNSFFAVEGGMALLTDNAKYLVPPVGYGGVGTSTSTSMSGSQLAAVIGLPFTEDFSILLRYGYTSMERANAPSPAEVEVNWKGTTYGLGAQYLLPFEIAVGRSKMRIGLRAGYNRFNLKDATGLLTETPTNTYVGGVIMF